MQKSNNFCVVGGGYWGSNHLKALNDIGVLGGLVETDKSIRDKAKREFSNLNVYSDINDAINEKNYNGFTIATPVSTHYSIAKKILESGSSVLVEKPFCVEIQQAKELVDIAKKQNLCLMVGHLLLFHDAISKIKESILSGDIGKLNYIYSNRLNLGKVRSYEDVFWSLAPHDISIIQFITESYPLKISHNSHSFLQKEISDVHLTHIEYPDNLRAHIFTSWYNPFKEHRLVIYGSEGFIDFRASHDDFFTIYKSTFEVIESQNRLSVDEGEKVFFENKEPLKEELIYFSEKVKNKEYPEIAGPESAIETTEIMLSMKINNF